MRLGCPAHEGSCLAAGVPDGLQQASQEPGPASQQLRSCTGAASTCGTHSATPPSEARQSSGEAHLGDEVGGRVDHVDMRCPWAGFRVCIS